MSDTPPTLTADGLQAYIASRGRMSNLHVGDMLDEIPTVDRIELANCLNDAWRAGFEAGQKAGKP